MNKIAFFLQNQLKMPWARGTLNVVRSKMLKHQGKLLVLMANPHLQRCWFMPLVAEIKQESQSNNPRYGPKKNQKKKEYYCRQLSQVVHHEHTNKIIHTANQFSTF